jgi:hypothetical protein
MCFSESASFTVSALLIPTGIYCIRASLTQNVAYLPFVCLPLIFGIQQGAEGMVWSGIHTNNPMATHLGSLVFLFFSHWFWLFWIPWIALNLEQNETIQHILRFFIIAGFLCGAFLYLPLLINDGWLNTTVSQGSIEYQAKFMSDVIPVSVSRLLYAVILLTPLLISSNLRVKILGELVTLSAFITYLIFIYAFASVWCFFAALLSFYIVYLILKTNMLLEEPLCRQPMS